MAVEVRAVQHELSRLGFDPGPADGLVGRRTRAAIMAFQDAAKLQRSGAVTPELLAALRAEPTPAPAATQAPAVTQAQPVPAEAGLGDLGFPDDDLDIED
jgi:peptidoglycan hydrolase-like protein with peptidoglycan-binding domain